MNKIDFALVITAEMCNPNGDPLMFNRPRIDIDGYPYYAVSPEEIPNVKLEIYD